MADIIDRRSTISVGELHVHLGYIKADVERIAAAIPQMATKQDIEALRREMDSFATKEELAAVKAAVEKQSISSTFDRWANVITKVGAIAAVFSAAFAALVHLVDRWPR